LGGQFIIVGHRSKLIAKLKLVGTVRMWCVHHDEFLAWGVSFVGHRQMFVKSLWLIGGRGWVYTAPRWDTWEIFMENRT